MAGGWTGVLGTRYGTFITMGEGPRRARGAGRRLVQPGRRSAPTDEPLAAVVRAGERVRAVTNLADGLDVHPHLGANRLTHPGGYHAEVLDD